MAYAAFSVVFGEQPSAAKWNILGSNDASFNDGTGIGTSAITTAKIADAGITSEKLAPTIYQNLNTSYPAVASAAYTDITGSNFSVTTTATTTKMLIMSFVTGRWTGAPSVETKANVVVDGVQVTESRQDAGVSGDSINHPLFVTTTHAAGTFTVKNQVKAASGTFQVFDNRTHIILLNS